MKEGFIDGSCMTCTGKTLAENLESCPDLSEGQQVIMPIDKPIKETGHLQTLYGNIAPDGSVAKITGKEGLYFKGFAKVYDSEEEMLDALAEDADSFKGSVIVISRGFRSISSMCLIALPAMKHSSIFSGSSAGMDDEYGSDMPSASIADAIVLAVYLRGL